MPELPEVEALRRRVEEGALNRTIERVDLGNDTSHIDLPGPDDRGRLEGTQFTEARRHGKYLFAGSKSGPWLALHMGMAGSVRVYDAADGNPDYARLIVAFEGERRLAFRDPRKFGWAKVVETPEDEIAAHDLGPDALDLDRDTFISRLSGGRGAVKSALLDQSRIAGIGNLWADETLYQTGIAPDVKLPELADGQIADLHRAAIRILRTVCDTDATYSELPDAWLIHRRETGRACSRCDGKIESKKVGGRTSYYCPDHQGGGG
ncbi:Fpg/Nei family DNA glycosylase [Jannaschia aquimarina]|uniref:MutM_1 protein n=1 Tax=Jannaschia aquimarina TaxID=935700 RepID=A0A0D1EMK2_9RHOB|nr:DNA-formamidopyrimidine glycosylase family protein [Jannaschia aquimarina]KIT16930.1 Formamidopyrimidine-DNA glycosylase [Jannaschia aquimarina]SNT11363.1 formamidopyrimidine-DNA glycosylase [Jannaschia aquimarina]